MLGVIVIAVTVDVGALAGGAMMGVAVGGRADEGNAAPLGVTTDVGLVSRVVTAGCGLILDRKLGKQKLPFDRRGS
jgi:hypothetical protein